MKKMGFRRTEKGSRQRGSETKTAKEKRKEDKGSERELENVIEKGTRIRASSYV